MERNAGDSCQTEAVDTAAPEAETTDALWSFADIPNYEQTLADKHDLRDSLVMHQRPTEARPSAPHNLSLIHI
eukprot:4946058-Pyramimonas_sp.AAC.1